MTLCIPTDGLTLNISPAPIAPTHRTSAAAIKGNTSRQSPW
jgi:hypothetical protein